MPPPPSPTLRLLSWNILHGGGPRRTPGIVLTLLDHRPDVVVLTEFRRTFGGQIAGVLADHGLRHQLSTNPAPACNGILIASRHPLLPGERAPRVRAFDPRDPDRCLGFEHRWLDARIPSLDLHLTAVHIPDARRHDAPALARKSAYWHQLLRLARARTDRRHVICGDFNTGRHGLDEPGRTFSCTPLLGSLATLGFVDAWRALHADAPAFSWFSPAGTGFRLDHAFLSPACAHLLTRAGYDDHARAQGLSDHAAMLLELAAEHAPRRA